SRAPMSAGVSAVLTEVSTAAGTGTKALASTDAGVSWAMADEPVPITSIARSGRSVRRYEVGASLAITCILGAKGCCVSGMFLLHQLHAPARAQAFTIFGTVRCG